MTFTTPWCGVKLHYLQYYLSRDRLPYLLVFIIYLVLGTIGFIVPMVLIGFPLAIFGHGVRVLFGITISAELWYATFMALPYPVLALLLLLLSEPPNHGSKMPLRIFLLLAFLGLIVLTLCFAASYIEEINTIDESGTLKGTGQLITTWGIGFCSGLNMFVVRSLYWITHNRAT